MKKLLLILIAIPCVVMATELRKTDYSHEVSAGRIDGASGLNKFGRSGNVDNGVLTDIWDLANSTDDVDIWVAPSTSRVHGIASTSALDDGDPVGLGARTIEVFGLTHWDSNEVSEVITLNGVSTVQTVNAYVIVHRMKVLTSGTNDITVGQITAVASNDNTTTAAILASEGQTQMAIYGIPSTKNLFLKNWYATYNRAAPSASAVDMKLCVNPNPHISLGVCQVKSTRGLQSAGTSSDDWPFDPDFKISGPAIVRVRAIGTANDGDVSAGFNGILEDK